MHEPNTCTGLMLHRRGCGYAPSKNETERALRTRSLELVTIKGLCRSHVSLCGLEVPAIPSNSNIRKKEAKGGAGEDVGGVGTMEAPQVLTFGEL